MKVIIRLRKIEKKPQRELESSKNFSQKKENKNMKENKELSEKNLDIIHSNRKIILEVECNNLG